MKPVFINRLNNFKDRFKRSFSLFAGRILTEKIENNMGKGVSKMRLKDFIGCFIFCACLVLPCLR